MPINSKPVHQTIIKNTPHKQTIINPPDEMSPIINSEMSAEEDVGNFPKAFTLKDVKYEFHTPFNQKMNYDIKDILINMDVYVSKTENFTIKVRDIFTDYILTYKNADDANEWLKKTNLKFWDQQLNFATYISSTCCGISMKDHLFNNDIPPQIKSFCRFHIYYTIRRILYELGGIQAIHSLPSDSVFNQFDNPYDESSYHIICDEFGISYNTDFRFKHDKSNNNGLGDGYIFWGGKPHKQLNSYKYNGTMFQQLNESFEIETIFGSKKKYTTSDANRAHWFKFQNDDYKYYNYFIPINSQGLTQAGLTRLNQSIKAYVYCVLGSQANTRTSIIGSSGGAQETRREFLNLLEDKSSGVIINRDIVDSIQRYQQVISDTNVKLD